MSTPIDIGPLGVALINKRCEYQSAFREAKRLSGEDRARAMAHATEIQKEAAELRMRLTMMGLPVPGLGSAPRDYPREGD